ncbi:22525_t:CDS:2, partial [Racocetra persica]
NELNGKSRSEPCGVKLIRLYGLDTVDVFIKKVKSDFEIEESVQEIKKSDSVFVATWNDGIRLIKRESGNHTRTISFVNLMELHYSRTKISDN